MSTKLHCDVCETTDNVSHCFFADHDLCEKCHEEFHTLISKEQERMTAEYMHVVNSAIRSMKAQQQTDNVVKLVR